MHRSPRAFFTLIWIPIATAWACTGCSHQVFTGVDVLIEDRFDPLIGKRVGLVTNPTGITQDLRSTVDVLYAAPEVSLVALFGPEHGVRGDVTAGEHVSDARDTVTGLPVYSLYGSTRKPTPEMLRGVDVLVYDIQDVGSRSYTFISTMGAAMAAAAENGVSFVVLDRPNPLTGNRVEGRPLDPQFKSFVGAFPIPYVYGMTCGELAEMINEEGWLDGGVRCDLTIVPMRGWRRSMWFDQTGLPWVATSPHVPRSDSATYYAMTGIMGELHVVSEGVGYTLPFENAGAPWIDADAFAQALNERALPGVHVRPTYFKPYYGRYQGRLCGGVQLHLVDRDLAHLTSIQFHIMDVVQSQYPTVKLFGAHRDRMFDKVCGTDRLRDMFLADQPIEAILDFWGGGMESFLAKRNGYLIYE